MSVIIDYGIVLSYTEFNQKFPEVFNCNDSKYGIGWKVLSQTVKELEEEHDIQIHYSDYFIFVHSPNYCVSSNDFIIPEMSPSNSKVNDFVNEFFPHNKVGLVYFVTTTRAPHVALEE